MPTKWNIFSNKVGGRNSRYRRYHDRVVVISNKTCLIFPQAAVDLLGKPHKALLLYDGNSHIGIRPVKENDPEYESAFTFQHPKKKDSVGTSCINCKAFLDKCNINPNSVFNIVSIENDIMVIDLGKYEIVKVSN